MITDVVLFIESDKWVPPEDRFCEYEPSDEDWCAPLQIGRFQKQRDVIRPDSFRATHCPGENCIEFSGRIQITDEDLK